MDGVRLKFLGDLIVAHFVILLDAQHFFLHFLIHGAQRLANWVDWKRLLVTPPPHWGFLARNGADPGGNGLLKPFEIKPHQIVSPMGPKMR